MSVRVAQLRFEGDARPLQQAAQQAQRALDGVTDAANRQSEALDKTVTASDEVTDASDNVTEAAENAADALDDIEESATDAGASMHAAAEGAHKFGQKLLEGDFIAHAFEKKLYKLAKTALMVFSVDIVSKLAGFTSIFGAVEQAGESVTEALREFGNYLSGGLVHRLDEAKKHTKELKEEIEKLEKTVKDRQELRYIGDTAVDVTWLRGESVDTQLAVYKRIQEADARFKEIQDENQREESKSRGRGAQGNYRPHYIDADAYVRGQIAGIENTRRQNAELRDSLAFQTDLNKSWLDFIELQERANKEREESVRKAKEQAEADAKAAQVANEAAFEANRAHATALARQQNAFMPYAMGAAQYMYSQAPEVLRRYQLAIAQEEYDRRHPHAPGKPSKPEKFMGEKDRTGIGLAVLETQIPLLTSLLDELDERAKRTKQMAEDIGQAFGSAFERAVLGGGKFRDVLQGLAMDIEQILLRRFVTTPLVDAITKGLSPKAMGGAFSGGGELALASGGVLNAPTHFMSGGRQYVAGEAGPEAVLPLARNSRGELGVKGGRGVVLNVYANDVQSFARSERQLRGIARRMAK